MLPIAVIPHTSAVFALTLVILVLSSVESVLRGGQVASPSQTQGIVTALQGFAVATLVVPLGSAIAGRRADPASGNFTGPS